MSPTESVTLWSDQLKSGDAAAAQRLWEAYFQRMVELARRKLEGVARVVADEEDVALSAFKSFCLGAREGRFTQLLDRDNLWPLLMAITTHKSVDLIRGQNRRKRGGTGGSKEPGSAAPSNSNRSAPTSTGASAGACSLSEILSREPTPEFAAEMSDQLERLLAKLDSTGDPDLRRIALLKLEGYRTGEIAERIGCVARTVERKSRLIAQLWGKDVEP